MNESIGEFMKVLKRQRNSKNCIICGLDNDVSTKAPFYEMENGTIATIFKYQWKHQSYPQRVHGGLITAMLDELIGRALWIVEPSVYGVTTTINIKFRKPVPYDELIYGVGKLTKNTKMFFGGIGKIFNSQGEVLAEAEINYIKQATSKIGDIKEEDEMVYDIDDGVKELDIDKFRI